MVRLQAVASTSGADGAAPHAEAASGAHGPRVAFSSDTVLHVRAPRGRVSGAETRSGSAQVCQREPHLRC